MKSTYMKIGNFELGKGSNDTAKGNLISSKDNAEWIGKPLLMGGTRLLNHGGTENTETHRNLLQASVNLRVRRASVVRAALPPPITNRLRG